MSFRWSVILILFALLPQLEAQSAVMTCNPAAVPTTVRAEGFAERTGDIVLTCSGGPAGVQVSGNIILSLNAAAGNRALADGTTDVTLTVNTGAGAVTFNARPYSTSAVAFNGVLFNASPQGSAELRFANLRGNASQFGFSTSNLAMVASLSFSGAGLAVPSSTFTVAYAQRGLYTTTTGRLVCDQFGSPLPATVTVNNLLSTSAASNTRITEGFASAFTPLSDPSNLRADSGTRVMVRYSGFVRGGRLFVPDAIAGSNADTPTSVGDFGYSPSGGQYTPGRKQLLLIRVIGADSNGAGGRLAMQAPIATTALNAASEVTLTNGAGAAVYEVADSDPNVRESAQLPVFLGLAPDSGASSTETGLSVTFAPLSTLVAQSSIVPVPRFGDYPPTSDCALLGDCGASYFPRLQVATASLTMTAPAGDPATQYVPIQNAGSGTLRWVATLAPESASSWLKLMPALGVNNSTMRVDAITKGLAVGTYQATITIDAGPAAGSKSIPVTLTVTPAVPPVPVIQALVNAANAEESRLVAGSLATLWGQHLAGKQVSVAFDGAAANVIFGNDSQINLRVPVDLSGRPSAKATVTVDGIISAPAVVVLADAAPAIFPGAVLNQNYGVNGPDSPAVAGSVLQVFATGLPMSGIITGKVHDRAILAPEYGGPAPGFPGVQQVNLRIPPDLPTMQTWVYVCGGPTSAAQTCSAPAPIWLAAQSR